MAATSINIKACKQVSETHNKREKELDYVRKDLTPKNEYWQLCSQAERRAEVRQLVKEKTGRKMQAKAEALREGVVVIDERTTMAQLQELAKRFKDRFGFETIQISIHRDEGHWVNADGVSTGTKAREQPREGDIWKPNLHAHMVFDWYNHETGKSFKTSKQDARDMQTITAEVLGMERGVASDKKHQDCLAYKLAEQTKEAEAKAAAIKELGNEVAALKATKVAKEEAKEAILSVFGAAKRQKTIKDQEKQLEALRSKNKALSERLERQDEELSRKDGKIEQQAKQIKAWEESDRMLDNEVKVRVAAAQRITRKAVEAEAQKSINTAKEEANKKIAAAEKRTEKAERTLVAIWNSIKTIMAKYYRAAIEGIVMRCTQPNVRFFADHHVEGIRTMMAPFDGAEAKMWVGQQLMSEGKAEAYKIQSRYAVDSWGENTARDVQRIAKGEQVRTMSQGRGMSR